MISLVRPACCILLLSSCGIAFPIGQSSDDARPAEKAEGPTKGPNFTVAHLGEPHQPGAESKSFAAVETVWTEYELVEHNGATYNVVRWGDVVISGRVRFVGHHPVIVIAADVMISGIVDVSAYGGSSAGPGGDGGGVDAWVARGGNGTQNGDHTSGGGGGGGMRAGGAGGAGNVLGQQVAGGAGGAGHAMTVMRGGAKGGDSCGAKGGLGGGALQISANRIVVSGSIYANGGGGAGGIACADKPGGGAGGGAGGLIYLQAPALAISGPLYADGGGGGAGAHVSGAVVSGVSGQARSGSTAPKGGKAGTGAGDGGPGPSGSLGGFGGEVAGGGGAGAPGFIFLRGGVVDSVSAQHVPSPDVAP